MRLLRSNAARAELLERDRVHAASLIRGLESQLQSKAREISQLSSALGAAYANNRQRTPQQQQASRHAAAARSPFNAVRRAVALSNSFGGSGGGDVDAPLNAMKRPFASPAGASHPKAAARESSSTHGFELIQVIDEAPTVPPPKYYQQHAFEEDPLMVLDGTRNPGAATAMAARAAATARMHHPPSTLIRMRGQVYELREVKGRAGGQPTAQELSHRVHSFLTNYAATPPPPEVLAVAAGATSSASSSATTTVLAPQAHRPAPRRPSSAQSRIAAQGQTHAGGSEQGGTAAPRVAPIRASRPQSAQAAMRTAGASPDLGVEPFGRDVLLYAAAQQQANSIRARYGV